MSRSPMLTVRGTAQATLTAVRQYVEGEIAATQEAMRKATGDERTEPAVMQLTGRLEAYLSVLQRLKEAKPR